MKLIKTTVTFLDQPMYIESTGSLVRDLSIVEGWGELLKPGIDFEVEERCGEVTYVEVETVEPVPKLEYFCWGTLCEALGWATWRESRPPEPSIDKIVEFVARKMLDPAVRAKVLKACVLREGGGCGK